MPKALITTAQNCSLIDKVFISTDDPNLMDIARDTDVEVIVRPDELCSDQALGDDAYVHGYKEIQKRNPNENIEFIVLLFCNAATITSHALDEGINILRDKPDIDSAVTVSRYNMWSPLRARRVSDDGTLKPFVPFETFGDPATLNCDRDSQGDVLYADMGCSIVRPNCLENLENGLLPQKWMGNNIWPIRQEAGCDIDYEWQVAGVEWWLKTYWDGQL